jgi:beta-alanine degradation protein BauB
MVSSEQEKSAPRVSPHGRPLGEIGDRILFENEQVRVWIVDLPPGGKQPWHQHYLPYVIISLTEGTNEIHFEDGVVRKTNELPGDVLWRMPGEVHELRNMADTLYRNILVEIK